MSTYDDAVMADEPVGFWYDADGHDAVGHRDAALVGDPPPGRTSTPNGDSAATFDGSSQYLEIADCDRWSPADTGRLTVEAWMRPSILDFPPDDYVHWLGKGQGKDEDGQQEWTLRMYARNTPRPNRVSVYAFNLEGGRGTGAYFEGGLDIEGGLDKVPIMKPNVWVHVVGVINAKDRSKVYPNGYVKIYRNGRLINTRDLFSTEKICLRNGTAPLRIGTQDKKGGFFQGAIGKVALYNYELLDRRVLAHHEVMDSPG